MDTTNAVRTRGYPPRACSADGSEAAAAAPSAASAPAAEAAGAAASTESAAEPPSVTPAAPAAQESAEDDPAEDRTANPAAPSLYTARTVPVPVRPHILFGQAPCLPGQRVGLMGLGQRTLWIVRADQLPARSSRRWASASRVRAWLPTAPRFVVM